MSKGATIGVGKSMSIEAVSRGMTLKGVLLGLAGREGMGGYDFTVMVSIEWAARTVSCKQRQLHAYCI
jgi:hypothetical protein